MNYQIANEHLKVSVSDTGAEMVSLCKDNVEYLWDGDAAYWSDQSPVLFPFVGRFTNGKYLLNGKEYEMDIHGFARKYPYAVIDKTENFILFEMTDNKETYPSGILSQKILYMHKRNKELKHNKE